MCLKSHWVYETKVILRVEWTIGAKFNFFPITALWNSLKWNETQQIKNNVA